MTDSPDPRLVVRDAIAAKIHEATCNKCPGEGEPRFTDEQLAEKVMDLFEVSEESWLIATVPGVNGPVDLRFQVHLPDRQPVTHTRLALRTVPVPVEPNWRTEGAKP